MKRFLITSTLFFVGSIIAVAIVFLLVFFSRETIKSEIGALLETAPTDGVSGEMIENEITEMASSTIASAASSTYALKDFALNEAQRNLLAAAGIDPETFIITEAMVICAKEKVGQQRFDEIIAGSSPSFLEMTRVVPCLSE